MTIFSKRQVYHSLSLLFFVILVTACSEGTRLIYSFTDKFIKDEINYFLDLDEEEKLLMNQQVLRNDKLAQDINDAKLRFLPR